MGDLQLDALLQQLMPIAVDALTNALNGQEDLGFSLGGNFNTPWGGAGGSLGWNQDEEDLQLGALISALAPVAINAIAGAIAKGQQDLGFSAGGSFTTPWGGAGGSLGWNQDEEDLQLGAIVSALAPVAINAIAGALK